MEWKPRLKLGIVGDYAAGKTCFMHRFVRGEWLEFVQTTTGLDGATKELTINSQSCIAVVYDTAGQEKFGTVTSSFYRNVTAVLILFDVSRKEGFERLASWIDEIGRFSISDYIIVAHKCDLEPAISKIQLTEFALQNKIEIMYASAKTGEGVEEAFSKVLQTMLAKEIQRKPKQSIDLNAKNDNKKCPC